MHTLITEGSGEVIAAIGDRHHSTINEALEDHFSEEVYFSPPDLASFNRVDEGEVLAMDVEFKEGCTTVFFKRITIY